MIEINERQIMTDLQNDHYTQSVLETASRRVGFACRLVVTHQDGVAVAYSDPNVDGLILVELNEGEKTLLLVALGKAFARAVKV